MSEISSARHAMDGEAVVLAPGWLEKEGAHAREAFAARHAAAPQSPAQPDAAPPASSDAPAPLEAVEQRLAALEALVLATVPAGYVTGAEVERLRGVVESGGNPTLSAPTRARVWQKSTG